MVQKSPFQAAIDPVIRPSARVARVAELLDEEQSQIRRMIGRGDLEGHRVGKRGVRVYLDSVEFWQRNNPIKATQSRESQQLEQPKRLSGATRTAHIHAVAHLRSLGLVQSSQP